MSAAAAGATALLYALAAVPMLVRMPLHVHGPPEVWPTLLLGCILVAASSIDLSSYRLPDALTLPLLVAGVVLSAPAGVDAAISRAAGAAVTFVAIAALARAYRRLRGREGLGLGDAKLLAAAAAWLGVTAIPTIMLLATSGALAMLGLAFAAGRRIGRFTRIPFGPFLAFSFWLVWLYRDLLRIGAT